MLQLDTNLTISPERICQMANAGYDSQVLFTAVDHDIFSVLSKSSKTAGQVAQEIGTDPYITDKLLNVLVSIQLLIKDSGKYSNTPLAETYLVKGETFYQGNYIKKTKKITFGTGSYGDWANIKDAIEHGYIPPDGGDMFQLQDESFSLAMKELSIHGEIQAAVEIISGYSWFKDMKNILDLGGTHGLYAIAFVHKNPNLKATLLDFPGVPALGNAKNHISQYEMEDRITIKENNFLEGDIGAGYDMIFISHLYFPKSQFDGILSRIHDALNKNGRFVLKNAVIHKNRHGSPRTALFELDMCLWSDESDEHCMFSIDEYVDQIETHGFVIENIDKIEYSSYGPRTMLIFKKEA